MLPDQAYWGGTGHDWRSEAHQSRKPALSSVDTARTVLALCHQTGLVSDIDELRNDHLQASSKQTVGNTRTPFSGCSFVGSKASEGYSSHPIVAHLIMRKARGSSNSFILGEQEPRVDGW